MSSIVLTIFFSRAKNKTIKKKQCHACHGMRQSISYSCHSLYFFGVNLLKKSKVHKFTFRLFLQLSIVGNLLSAAYRLVEYPRHGPLDIAIMFFAFGLGKASLTILSAHERIQKLFALTIPNLTEEEREAIKKFDRNLILGQCFVIGYTFITQSGYTVIYGDTEMIAFALGVNFSKNDTIGFYYKVMAYLGPCEFYLLYIGFWNCAIYYILIVALVKAFASNCATFSERHIRNGIRKPNTSEAVFRETLIRFKFYNSMVNEVNDCLASIPFLMVSFKFLAVVSGFSYLATYDSNFSLKFTANCSGITMPYTSLLLHYTVHLSCDASDIMKSLRTDVVNLLESMQNPSVQGVYASCSKWYLEIEPIAKMSMGNVFDTNRSFLLSFAEAILPFTIMIVTTTRALDPVIHEVVNVSIRNYTEMALVNETLINL